MAKQKKKTKEVEYAAKYLHDTLKMSVKNIALELGVAEAVVDGILNSQPEFKDPQASKTQDLMIRHSAVKKTNNVSIMTESASQRNDELKKRISNNGTSRTGKNSIFRPNDK